MARRVFFSFHYTRDAWRVSQVRNAWVLPGSRDANTIVDHASWEEIMRKGSQAIKNWIDAQMNGSSVVAVLIGRDTHTRPWVEYEIRKAHQEGRGILGVHLAGMKNSDGTIDAAGTDPIAKLGLTDKYGARVTYPTYSWLSGSGRSNFPLWVEAAAKRAGR
jgi:hypothetical protein